MQFWGVAWEVFQAEGPVRADAESGILMMTGDQHGGRVAGVEEVGREEGMGLEAGGYQLRYGPVL